MWEIILDAFLDTLIVLPFLIIIYILIEFLEHRTTFTRNHKILQGNVAPLIGSATGLIAVFPLWRQSFTIKVSYARARC